MIKTTRLPSRRGRAACFGSAVPATLATIATLGFAAGSLALFPSTLLAQVDEETTTTTETTESAGTISEFGPESIVIRTERSSEPIPFTFSKTITYVDETGAPVARETIRRGAPVTVYYTREGGHMVATRVVVRKAASAPPPTVIEHKTTTTTTEEDDR